MTPAFWITGFYTLLTLLIGIVVTGLVMGYRARSGLAERASFFRSTSDLIVILDDALIVREMNRAARIKLHLETDEGIGEKIENTVFWPANTKDQRKAMNGLRSALDGERALFSITINDADGKPTELEVRAFPMRSPWTGHKELICYGKDVTVEFGSLQRLRRRTEVEDIITRMMESSFADGDARKRVPGILELAGDFLGARRGFLLQTDRRDNIIWKHLWSAPGVPLFPDSVSGMNINSLIPFNIRPGMMILRDIPENTELPEEVRKQASESGMGSLIFTTLAMRNGQVYGYAGFSFNETQPPEDGSALILIKLLASTMTGLLSRMDDQRDIKLFRESVDAAGQGIALIGEDGLVIYSNTTYRTLTGHASDMNRPIWEHYVGSYSDKVRKLILPMVSSGKRWNGELQIQNHNGLIIDTIETFVPVDTMPDDPGYTINMITDISDRKRLEAQLINARKDAEIANRAKSDYLANMSHEIRTPMNAVIGLAYLALQTELDSRQKDYLTKINTAAKGLLNIINDILDLSKIEAGRLELESAPFSLDMLLENAVNLAVDTAREKGLKLLYYRPPELPDRWVGDRFRLGQVLLNLVGNAVKFTNEGRVTVSVRNDMPGYLRFIVEDTGIGMTESQISRLFNPFQQAEASTSRVFGGTGLGLTISKQIVDLMEGVINVSSTPGTGSRFEFTVAMQRDSITVNQTTPNRTEPERGSASVISADNLSREFHVNALEAIGYATTACRSIKEVLENPNYPDLLLLDIDGCCKDPKAAAYALTDGAGDEFLLILSGSRSEEELSGFAPDGIRMLPLPMPYSRSRLREALDEFRDATGTAAEVRKSHQTAAFSARILLADDNAINRQVGMELLSSAGLDVDVAHDGREAVILCDRNDYNLIFMDLHMPVMDGYIATENIRQSLPDLPIIAMTASTLNDVKTDIMDAGFSGYIAKPIDPEQVLQTLSKELGIPEALLKTSTRERVIRSRSKLNLDGIDENKALRQVLGDREKLDNLLKTYVEEHAEDSIRIEAGPDEKDKSTLIALLHSLRGSSGQIGATAIMKASGELEESLRNNRDIPSGSFTDLAQSLSSLISGIENLYAGKALDQRLLDELEELIRNSDEAAVNLLEAEITDSAGDTALPHIEKIRAALSRWDYDDALDAVDDWRVSITEGGK